MVAAGILVSRLVGLVRNWAFARYLGDSAAADAYTAAIKIPNIVRALLGEGAISASFIPVYSGMLGRADEREARALAGTILGLLLVFVSALTLIGIAVAPVLTTLLAPGLDPGRAELTTRLVRVLFPMTGLMVISGWCLGIQNSHRRFFNSYASAALWSVAQIALLLGWGSRAVDLQQLAWWLAWATLVGAALQVLAQLPEVVRLVRPLTISLDPRVAGVPETVRNFVPVVIALGLVQISALIDLQIASFLPSGAIASIAYAALVYVLPISLFGLSVAASSLPEFARESSVALDALRDRLRSGWLRILFYIVPSAALFLAHGDLVVAFLFRGGRFGADETRIVYWILAGYSLGLVAYASVRLLASAFYAMQDYRTPLRASVLAIVSSAVLALSIALPLRHSPLGAVGIAIGSALGAYANLVVLTRGLRARLGPLFTPDMWHATWRIAASALLAAAAAAPVRWLLQEAPVRLAAAGTMLVFGGIFLVAAYQTGSDEAGRWLRTAKLIRPSS